MKDLNPRYGDVCDSGHHPARRVVALPLMAIPDGDGGLLAGYRCPVCRHAWTCAWAVVPGRVLPPEPTDPVALADVDLVRRLLAAAALRSRPDLPPVGMCRRPAVGPPAGPTTGGANRRGGAA